MYSPVLGRFQSRDPLPLEGEPDVLYGDSWINRNINARMNLYAYASSNPINRIDPSGLQDASLCQATGTAAKPCDGICLRAIRPIKLASCKITALEYSAGPEECKTDLEKAKKTFGLDALCGQIKLVLADWNNSKNFKDGDEITIVACHKCGAPGCKETADVTFAGKNVWSFKDYTISVFTRKNDPLQCSFKVSGDLEFDSEKWSVFKCETK